LVKTTRPNGTVMTIAYNAAGQITQQKDVDADGNVINQYDYEYDEAGNITVEESVYETDTYKLTNAVMTYDSGNRLITYNGQNVLYDEDGNMTYGPLNNEMVSFTYDSRNRLIKAGSTTYEYDAENNRIAVIENGVRTEYVNNPNAYLSQLLIKKDSNGNEIFYIYGAGLIGQEDEEGNYITYHYDFRGSTTALTDEDGNVIARYNYGPYGELVESTGYEETPFLYNGRDGVMTDANGLYYMRARYYNPEIKRFINQDVLAGYIEDGRTLNRYAYVNGNPVSLTDPFGLSPELTASKVVHGILDIISMIDPTGIVDGINGLIYLAEGDYFNAGLSFACALIPFAFDAGAKAAKWGSKAFKATKAGQKLVTVTAKAYDFARPVVNTISNTLCKVRSTKVGKWVTSKYTRDAVAGAAFSAAAQKAITDEIDWKQVAKSAAISVVAGKISRKILGVPDFSGGQCFTEDTLIIVKNGAKLIKDIEIGDEVYSANPETGEKGLKKVTNVFVSETNVLVHVFTGNEEIRTTLGHPFWVEGKGWIDAAYLEAGDKLRTYDGELVEIVKVKLEYLDEVIKGYNFEVEDWHTYFVSSTEVLVHNMCDPKLRVGSEGTSNIFKNGRVTVEAIESNPSIFKGKSANEIADILRSEGYDVTVQASAKSRSGAQIIKINNAGNGKNISQVQVSPGGGRHGANPYVKISTTDQGIIKIVDGLESAYKTDGAETAKIIFTGGK
jgi:RHS repeat-associated protein